MKLFQKHIFSILYTAPLILFTSAAFGHGVSGEDAAFLESVTGFSFSLPLSWCETYVHRI